VPARLRGHHRLVLGRRRRRDARRRGGGRRGRGRPVVTVGVLEPEITVDAVSLIGKVGRVVLTSVSRAYEKSISLTGSPMVGWHKRIRWSLAGGSNPILEMPNLLGLYKSGHLKLHEIIMRRYPLEQVNEGYHDLPAGTSSTKSSCGATRSSRSTGATTTCRRATSSAG
jgi:Zn-dependent alcohol dehydrogenase